jgi:hypothetical protein
LTLLSVRRRWSLVDGGSMFEFGDDFKPFRAKSGKGSPKG